MSIGEGLIWLSVAVAIAILGAGIWAFAIHIRDKFDYEKNEERLAVKEALEFAANKLHDANEVIALLLKVKGPISFKPFAVVEPHEFSDSDIEELKAQLQDIRNNRPAILNQTIITAADQGDRDSARPTAYPEPVGTKVAPGKHRNVGPLAT